MLPKDDTLKNIKTKPTKNLLFFEKKNFYYFRYTWRGSAVFEIWVWFENIDPGTPGPVQSEQSVNLAFQII